MFDKKQFCYHCNVLVNKKIHKVIFPIMVTKNNLMGSLKNKMCSLTNSGAIFFENCGLWLPIQKVKRGHRGHTPRTEKPRSAATKTQKRTHFIERQTLKLLYFSATS